MSPYSADAVLAAHIGDQTTPHSKRKPWRVAFYKNGRLFAVLNRPYARLEAEKAAADAELQMSAVVERYIESVARKEKL